MEALHNDFSVIEMTEIRRMRQLKYIIYSLVTPPTLLDTNDNASTKTALLAPVRSAQNTSIYS
jgi:hypothetical protein